jgi:Fe-S-cluster-containing hydrogenase component 2
MSSTPSLLSRRDWLCFGLRSSKPTTGTTPSPVYPRAIVQGRHCLAYRSLSCTTCVEHCPVSGAIVTQGGVPQIEPALCTACGRCKEVCPAPHNAILML